MAWPVSEMANHSGDWDSPVRWMWVGNVADECGQGLSL